MRKHRKKQCQTWSRILQHQWFCWFLPRCFPVFCRNSQQSYISPLESAFWALTQTTAAGTDWSQVIQIREPEGKLSGEACVNTYRERTTTLHHLRDLFFQEFFPNPNDSKQRQWWRNSTSSNLDQRRHPSSSWDDPASQFILLYHHLHPCHQSRSSCAPVAVVFLPGFPEDQTAAHYVGSITLTSLALR